jgi:putative transposase
MENQHCIQFFTATILKWKHLLKSDKYKQVIIESLAFLAEKKRVEIFGFVIMPNHIHLIWRLNDRLYRENVQRDFLKFTSQQIIVDLKINNPDELEKYRVNAKDRKYQIWERNALSVDLYSKEVLEQKLIYIHNNPMQEKWNLATEAESYLYSSVRFYEKEIKEWDFLKHYIDEI